MALRFDCRHRYEDGFELAAQLEVGDGVTAICGPSGSGKTTILALVAGLLRPGSGRIVLDDSVFVDTSERVWVPSHRRSIGLVFQDSLLFPHRSVLANLTYGLRRRPTRQVDLDRVLEVLELGDLVDRFPATLSGGQLRRVAIGRALLSGPRLLMLDEPWTGLDQPLRERVSTFLERCLAEWDIPTLLVSHDRDTVERLAERVVTLRAGRVETIDERI